MIFHFRNEPLNLVSFREPDLTFTTGQLWSWREQHWPHSTKEKQGKCWCAFGFPCNIQGYEVKVTPVLSPLDVSCTPAMVLYAHACTYTQTQKLHVIAKALPGSGWGLGGGRTRPWEPQDTGGKMSRAQQRCGGPRAETKAKTNPAGPQGATGGHGATRPVPPASPGSQGSARPLLLSRISNSIFWADGLHHRMVYCALSWNVIWYSQKNTLSLSRFTWLLLNCWLRKGWQTWNWPIWAKWLNLSRGPYSFNMLGSEQSSF